ncbi:amidohydrolase family protein [Nonomuraea sp. NPDC050394]|uniref:amidohydrolase family protein n=1 Tax=Nonomuraea sp. NPDC050394 TaxID=3364363 RepID=UPI0037875DB3
MTRNDVTTALAAQLRRRVRCAQGLEPADLVLKNCSVVNVHLERTHRADIVVLDGRVVAVRDGYAGDAGEVVDCAGRLAVPGLVQVLASADDHLGHGTTSVVEVATAGRGGGSDLPRTLRAAAGSPPLAVLPPGAGDGAGPARAKLRDGHVVLVSSATMLIGLDHRNVCLGPAGGGTLAGSVTSAIEAGVPLPRAVQLATLNPAMAFGVDHEVGSIAPGRWADVALLAGRDACVPVAVYLGGRRVS